VPFLGDVCEKRDEGFSFLTMNLIYHVFLTSSLVLLPFSTTSPAIQIPLERPVTPVVRSISKSATTSPSQILISKKVEQILGKDMLSVVKCESNFRQFNSDGSPLVSPTSDVGVMQINQVHWSRAEELGLDIFYSTNDNIIMGKIILDEQGHNAWTCHKLEVDV
jgi:hypothetical protein